MICAGRRLPPAEPRGAVEFIHKGFTRDLDARALLPHLADVHVVINAAGVLAGKDAVELTHVHTRGPIA